MYRKLIQIAMMFILLACASTGTAFAQDTITDPVTGVFSYDGAETSPGVFDPLSLIQYNNTFVLKSTGESETRHLTISLNYYKGTSHGVESLNILGGTWTLVTYKKSGQYMSTLYGDVTSGALSFITNSEGKIGKRIDAELLSRSSIRGIRKEHKDLIKSTLEIIIDADSTLASGNLNLDF